MKRAIFILILFLSISLLVIGQQEENPAIAIRSSWKEDYRKKPFKMT